jgi:hypothetical protein
MPLMHMGRNLVNDVYVVNKYIDMFNSPTFNALILVFYMRICIFSFSQLWVLDGVNGEIRNGWPVKVDGRLSSVPLVTRLYDLDKILFVSYFREFSVNLHDLSVLT